MINYSENPKQYVYNTPLLAIAGRGFFYYRGKRTKQKRIRTKAPASAQNGSVSAQKPPKNAQNKKTAFSNQGGGGF